MQGSHRGTYRDRDDEKEPDSNGQRDQGQVEVVPARDTKDWILTSAAQGKYAESDDGAQQKNGNAD